MRCYRLSLEGVASNVKCNLFNCTLLVFFPALRSRVFTLSKERYYTHNLRKRKSSRSQLNDKNIQSSQSYYQQVLWTFPARLGLNWQVLKKSNFPVTFIRKKIVHESVGEKYFTLIVVILMLVDSFLPCERNEQTKMRF